MLTRKMKSVAVAVLLSVTMMIGMVTVGNAKDAAQINTEQKATTPNAVSSQGAQSPSSKAPPLIKKAEGLLDSWHGQKGVLDQAKRDIDTVLTKDPQNIYALVQLARYYMKSRHTGEKIMGVSQAVTIGLFQPGTLELCENALLKALKANPRFADVYVLLGYVYMEEEKFDQALDAYKQAQAIGTDNPRLHLHWAELLRLEGDVKGALDQDRQLIDSETAKKPVSESARVIAVTPAKGLLDSWRGDGDLLKQAKADIDAVLAKDPENVFALVELARYYMKRGYLHNSGGISVVEPGTYEQAESILLKALHINPKFADGYVLLGYVYMEEGKYDLALDNYKKAKAIGTNNPWLHLNWAQLLSLKGDEKGAQAEAMKVVNSEEAGAANNFLLSHYIDHKEYKKADALYINMVNLKPTDAWLAGNYAMFLLNDIGDLDRAIEYAEKSLDIMNYGVGHKILAKCLYAKWANLVISHKGSDLEAQKLFDSAYENFSDFNTIMALEGSYAIHKPLVLALKEKGVSIDATADEFDGSLSALNYAAVGGRADAVEMLLSLGANPNVYNKGSTPLLLAANEGYAEIVKLLLEHGANAYQTLGWKDAAALADSHKHAEVAQMIRQYVKDHPVPLQEHLSDELKAVIMQAKPSSGITATTDEEKRAFISGAEHGDLEALYGIGDIYEWGHGVPVDHKQAMTWYRKAADQGNTIAEIGLGRLISSDASIHNDLQEEDLAIMWYQKAADQGNPDGKKLVEQAQRDKETLRSNAEYLKLKSQGKSPNEIRQLLQSQNPPSNAPPVTANLAKSATVEIRQLNPDSAAQQETCKTAQTKCDMQFVLNADKPTQQTITVHVLYAATGMVVLQFRTPQGAYYTNNAFNRGYYNTEWSRPPFIGVRQATYKTTLYGPPASRHDRQMLDLKHESMMKIDHPAIADMEITVTLVQ